MGEFIPHQKSPEVSQNNRIRSFVGKIKSFSFTPKIKPQGGITRVSGDLYGTIDKNGHITLH